MAGQMVYNPLSCELVVGAAEMFFLTLGRSQNRRYESTLVIRWERTFSRVVS